MSVYLFVPFLMFLASLVITVMIFLCRNNRIYSGAVRGTRQTVKMLLLDIRRAKETVHIVVDNPDDPILNHPRIVDELMLRSLEDVESLSQPSHVEVVLPNPGDRRELPVVAMANYGNSNFRLHWVKKGQKLPNFWLIDGETISGIRYSQNPRYPNSDLYEVEKGMSNLLSLEEDFMHYKVLATQAT